jgi:YHS domain-containing protein
MRGLLFLAVAVFVVVVLMPMLRGWRPRLSTAPAPGANDLVKDPVCQTYIVRSRAVRQGEGETAVYFCSPTCAERYAGGGRRA